jgi:bifunctional non-homologous end joining protein LigD
VKASQEQEVVIIGFTTPRRSREYFGSLLLAVRDGKSWKYAGRAGTGFTHATLRKLYSKLKPLITKTKPVTAKVPNEANTTWVKPKLVAEVKFTEWTAAGEIRHPVFLGLRTAKPATEVTRETPKPLREAKPASHSKRR